eukprot:CAMPEP_0172744490 /NCGR_PEP_ID=MMETSP1074-20121228/135335_1 /TAXON_ID=2916 /ORGANISM="Ceratium fusus, Strain PA161109" /LENGTH=31 /DNA_ID= /DNA_START= /DNA_END= /DNA_ORIENTATION=
MTVPASRPEAMQSAQASGSYVEALDVANLAA